MLMKAADYIASRLFSDVKQKAEYALSVYGIELWLYTIISTIGLLLVGFVSGNLFESSAIIYIYYVCQSNGGGFHAKTRIGCFLTMSIGLTIGLILITQLNTILFPAYACILGFIVLMVFPLCLHENKQYLKCKEFRLRINSRLHTLFVFLAVLATYWLSYRLFVSGCIGVLLASVSRVIGLIMHFRKYKSTIY